MPAPWLLLGAGAFGWLWGSFLNTIVDRTPRRAGPAPAPGWFTPPRSMCFACGADIAAWDNVPIVSYLLLRGRCRGCHAPIGPRTLAMEVATPLLVLALVVALAGRATWPWLAWCIAALSTAIVAAPMLLERRQVRRIGVATVLLAAAAMLLWTVA